MLNMKESRKFTGTAAVALIAVTAIGFAAASCEEKRDVSQRSSEASVVTNDNGSVSRAFVESTVTTNGSMVTEHRRETRTTLDTEGNMLESSTSEYTQSYSVGETPFIVRESTAANADSFLGLRFGDEFKGTNLVHDAEEPTLLKAAFVPAKTLAGFDDYYVYVTPKTHKIAKVCACAKNAVEPGAHWRRHYLIEALEKRYQTGARLCSYRRPCYAFDIGSGRFVTACLARASREHETVLTAWDDALLTTAADEVAAIREAARKAAAERRMLRVNDAADAF